VLQRVEEQIPAVKEIRNSRDLLVGELGSSSKTCVTSTLNGNEVIGIEAERVSNITEEEVQKQTTIPVIMTEPKNCMDFVEGELGSSSKTCVTLSRPAIS
jgi:hypothetical protein